MEIVEGQHHDPLCASYQTLEMARLNDVLKACGIEDTSQRRRICEEYFFRSGYFLDSCWFTEDGERYRPGIYFSSVGKADSKGALVYLPDPSVGTMLHEYVHGAAGWLFDEHGESAEEIEVGDSE